MNPGKSFCPLLSTNRMAAIAIVLPALVLAACTQADSPSATSSANSQASASAAADTSLDIPKVPFGGQPCRSLSADEMRRLGFTTEKPFSPGRDPDRLASDNTCDFGGVVIVYTTQGDYQDQKENLRSSKRSPPAYLPDAFYDVLGNLWFAEKGYYVAIPNNVSDADKVKVAHAIAAKL